MVSNNLKKMIVFSSEVKRKVLEGIIKDQASQTGSSESAIIEQTLTKKLLPSNENALFWVERLYNGGTLAEAYTSVFAYLAAGPMWEAKHDNGRPLVAEFARLVAMDFPILTGGESELHHLLSQLTSIYELLPEGGSMDDKNLCKICIQQLQNDPQAFYLIDLTSLILRNWDNLKNYTHTYRALVDLARLSAPRLRDVPRSRTQFTAALDEVSRNWQE